MSHSIAHDFNPFHSTQLALLRPRPLQIPTHHLDLLMELNTINATICLHPIRSAAELPLTTHGIDFAVPYCRQCTRSRKIAEELDIAEHEHNQLKEAHAKGATVNREEASDARVRYRAAYLASTQDREEIAERNRKERGSLSAGTDRAVCWNRSILKRSWPKKKVSVRFDVMDKHRPEEEYRDSSRFLRDSSEGSLYEPGIWADASGNGFINTSDPYASEEERDREVKDGDLRDGWMRQAQEAKDGQGRGGQGEKPRDSPIDDVLSHVSEEDSDEEVTHGLAGGQVDDEGDEDFEMRDGDKGAGEEEEDDPGDAARSPLEEGLEDDDYEESDSNIEMLTREEILERRCVILEALDQLQNRRTS